MLFKFNIFSQELLEFLTRVIAAENVNRMGLNNVAMIMAPNLFMRGGNRANLDEINKAAATTDVMRMLIKYQNIIWTVCCNANDLSM